MEAHLHGVSTRKVNDPVRALGADTGISKSEVSPICADLDAEVAAFRDRSLVATAFPCVFLDATSCQARVDRRVGAPVGGVPPRGGPRRPRGGPGLPAAAWAGGGVLARLPPPPRARGPGGGPRG